MAHTVLTSKEVALDLLRIGNASSESVQIIADLNGVSALDVRNIVGLLKQSGCLKGRVIYREKLLEHIASKGATVSAQAEYLEPEAMARNTSHRKGKKRTVREDEPQDYVPISVATKYMQVSRSAVNRWIAKGCPSKKENGTRLICIPEVRSWLKQTMKKLQHL